MSLRSRINGKTRRMRKLPSQKDFDKWWANKAANEPEPSYEDGMARNAETNAIYDYAANYPDEFTQDYNDFNKIGGYKKLHDVEMHDLKSDYYRELANPAGKYNGRQRRTLRKLARNEHNQASDKGFDMFENMGNIGGNDKISYQYVGPDGKSKNDYRRDVDPTDIMYGNARHAARQNVRHKDESYSYNNDLSPDYRIKDPYNEHENEEKGEWVRMPGNLGGFIRHDYHNNPVDDEASDFNQEPEDDYDDSEDEGEE